MPGYSGTPLARKLGFIPGTNVVVVGDVPSEYKSWLAPLPERVTLTNRGKPPLEAVHAFVTKRAEQSVRQTRIGKTQKNVTGVRRSYPHGLRSSAGQPGRSLSRFPAVVGQRSFLSGIPSPSESRPVGA